MMSLLLILAALLLPAIAEAKRKPPLIPCAAVQANFSLPCNAALLMAGVL